MGQRPGKGMAVAMVVAAGVATASVGGATAASAAEDGAAPALTSFTTSATGPVDVTTADGQVTITAQLSDAGGVERAYVNATYARAASADPRSVASGIKLGYDVYEHPMQRVSGTATAGTWRVVLPLPAGTRGTWDVELAAFDLAQNALTLSSAQLVARGLPARVAVQTTRAPGRPTLSGRTNFLVNPAGSFFQLDRTVSWRLATGSAKPAGYAVESAWASCGKLRAASAQTWIPASVVFSEPQPPVPCQVKLRLVNAAGASPQASVTFV